MTVILQDDIGLKQYGKVARLEFDGNDGYWLDYADGSEEHVRQARLVSAEF